MPLVELPDGREVEFPDGTTPAAMTAVLRRDFTDQFPLDEAAYADYQRRQQLASAPPGAYPAEPGTELTQEMFRTPLAPVKTVFGMGAGAAALPGKLAYLAAADTVAAIDPEHGKEYGGNLNALFTGNPDEPLPVQNFIGQVAKTNPKSATTANVAKALPELASMMAVNPSGAAGRLLAAGFSADMIANAKPLFDEYAAEINKPPDEQDAGKRAELEAGIIQTFTFAPLAAGHAAGRTPTPGETAGRMLAKEVSRADFKPVPVPESPAALKVQVEATLDPYNPKAVTLVTPGEPRPEAKGLVSVDTAMGEALVNADKVDPKLAKAELDAGRGGQLLGMSTPEKPPLHPNPNLNPDLVLETKTPEGVPVQQEVVTPETLPAAVEAGKAVAPEGTQEVKPAEQILQERQAATPESEAKAIKEFLENYSHAETLGGSVPAKKPYLPTRDEAFAARYNAAKTVDELVAMGQRPSQLVKGMEDARNAIENGIKLGYQPRDIAKYLRQNYLSKISAKEFNKLAGGAPEFKPFSSTPEASPTSKNVPPARGPSKAAPEPTTPPAEQSLPPEIIQAKAEALANVRQNAEEGGLIDTESQGTSAMGFPLQAPAAAPVPPTPAPTPAPGTTMIQNARLPVTLPRTGEGSVSIPQIMESLVNVQRMAGSAAGNIRTGRFTQRALGIFKPHEEIIRLGSADSLPTATHEVGHALQKQLYGTSKASGLKVLPSDVRRELQGMGKALYGSRKPAAGYTGEGFAEFMRYWLSTDDAAKVAPKTAAFFEQQVLPKYPDVAEALKNSRGLLDVWRAQGSVERAQRQLVREPGAFARVAKTLGGLVTYQAQFESGAPLKAVSEAAERKLGRPLPPSQDPYKLFSFKRGSAGATVERMVMNHMLDVWGNPTGPSLSEALAPIKGRRKEFALYVFAKAAEMRWQQGKNPGIALEDAQHIKALYDSPEFRLAADKYKDWQNGLLDYVVQADPTMADAVANMRGANDFYAPLARLIDPAQAKRAAAQARSNPFMRMHGSGLPVKDIFDQTIINAARLVNRANKALVTQAVIKTAQIPGLGHLIEEVPRAKVMEKVNIEKLRDQLEAMGVDTSRRPGPNNTMIGIPDDEILQYASFADAPKGSDPIVAVKDSAGQTRWYQVDPRLYETLDGLQTFSLKNSFPNLPGLGAALDLVISAPGRMFKLGVTGLRAPFSLITNPARDLPTALVQSSVNPARFAAEYPAALGGVLRAGFGGKEGPGVQQFYDLGAHMGQPLGIDITHTKRVSNELFHGRFLRTVLNPLDHLRQLFSITEAAPRVAELRAVANEIGWQPGTKMTPDQATQMALAAKQVTVDFSAMGDLSRLINSAVPFYNPAVQGLRSFGRAFQEHPVRATLMGLAVFTVPALLNWWRNKDKQWYQALPWRERYTYTNIDDGKNVWRIPRPFDWGNAFMVMPEAALDSWYRQDPRAANEALAHIFNTQNPLDYPVLLKLAKEQWQNRIEFWDRPIVPRGEVDLPPAAQVGPYTSKLAIGINKAFPNVSPRRVDAALRGYFGGVYSDLVGSLGLTASQVDREWEKSDLPVLGVLFRRGGEFNAQNQNISDFYDAYIPAQAKLTAVQQQQKRGTGVGNLITLTPGEFTAAEVGDDASKAIITLLRLANSTKEIKARQELYRTANDIAVQANTVIKNAQRRR